MRSLPEALYHRRRRYYYFYCMRTLRVHRRRRRRLGVMEKIIDDLTLKSSTI